MGDELAANELMHHGVKGQQWYKRKYQYPDGSLTPLGRLHYGVGAARQKTKERMTAATEAARKKLKPTSEDLQEQYDKELEKNERQRLKMAIRETKANRKKDKYSLMTEDEINNEINRIQKELRLNDLRKQLKDAVNPPKEDGPFKAAVKAQVQKYAAEALGQVAKSAITKAGERLLMTEEDRAKRAYNIAKSKDDTSKLVSGTSKINAEIARLKAQKELDDLKSGKDDSSATKKINDEIARLKAQKELDDLKSGKDSTSSATKKINDEIAQLKATKELEDLKSGKDSTSSVTKRINDEIAQLKAQKELEELRSGKKDSSAVTQEDVHRAVNAFTKEKAELAMTMLTGNDEAKEEARKKLKELKDLNLVNINAGGGGKKNN